MLHGVLKELIKVFFKLTFKFLIFSLNFSSCTLGIGDTDSVIISPNSWMFTLTIWNPVINSQIYTLLSEGLWCLETFLPICILKELIMQNILPPFPHSLFLSLTVSISLSMSLSLSLYSFLSSVPPFLQNTHWDLSPNMAVERVKSFWK